MNEILLLLKHIVLCGHVSNYARNFYYNDYFIEIMQKNFLPQYCIIYPICYIYKVFDSYYYMRIFIIIL